MVVLAIIDTTNSKKNADSEKETETLMKIHQKTIQ